jgi:hypothetical protein
MISCPLAPESSGASDQAGAEAPRDLLSAYLIDLLNNQFMVPTVMERMHLLHEWRAFAMSDDLEELYLFLDRWSDHRERWRRFVAIRSYARWLAGRGHAKTNWTAGADLRRVSGR